MVNTLDDDDLWRVDLFAVLGITPETPREEIRNAYKALAKQLHPDRFLAGSAEQEAAKELFSLINRAYEVLYNDTKKAQYLDTRRLLAEHLPPEQQGTAATESAPAPAAEPAPAPRQEASGSKFSAQDYKKKQADDLYKEALRLNQKNLLDDAITAYQQAIALDAQVAKYHSGLGQAYAQKGWKGMAHAAFKQALVLDPRDATAKKLYEPEKPKKKGLMDSLKELFKK